ncbi:MAG TPA: acyl-CoA dehydrogenase family protein [Acidimicrobiales bacterium]|nr:acyl-CoA dehydrogenase family protein [Acidimicrobiales bacterium]
MRTRFTARGGAVQIVYNEEQEALRRELREYFSNLMTEEVQQRMSSGDGEYGGGSAYRDLVRQMGKDGWLGIGWPTEYGGQNRSMMEQLIFTDEASRAGAPVPFLTINTVGPTIMEYGTDEQRRFFLPKILTGEMHFAIGYSEPDAGTDLARLRTRAVRDGDEYIINGQKMWTSLIEHADYVWLAARTDPDAPRHKGLSVFLVPTDSAGFKWTPVPTVTGATTSQTFYEDVRVPTTALVGDENSGWRLITGQLNRERVALCSAAGVQTSLEDVRRWAQQTKLPDGRRVIDQEWVRLNLARVHAKVEFLKLINWKIAWGVDKGVSPADASATKVFGTEFYTEAYRLLMDCMGDDAYITQGSPGAVVRGRIERAYRGALILTFGGGTNEIQRDIISMVALGMPRAPR